MSLDLVISGKQPRPPRRMVVFGTHGVGKSTFAAKADNPIFIQTEDGLGDIECSKFPLAKEWWQIERALDTLKDEEHDYKTVVIDSLDWLETLIWKQTCLDKSVNSIEDIGYQKGYTFCLEYWHTVFDKLDELRNEKGMGVILIAHSKVEQFKHPEVEAYDRYAPRLHKHAAAAVQEWADEVFFATTEKPFVRSDGEGKKTRHIASPIESENRVLKTVEQPTHLAKNRLGKKLPPVIPLDYDLFREFLNGGSPYPDPEPNQT